MPSHEEWDAVPGSPDRAPGAGPRAGAGRGAAGRRWRVPTGHGETLGDPKLSRVPGGRRGTGPRGSPCDSGLRNIKRSQSCGPSWQTRGTCCQQLRRWRGPAEQPAVGSSSPAPTGPPQPHGLSFPRSVWTPLTCLLNIRLKMSHSDRADFLHGEGTTFREEQVSDAVVKRTGCARWL